MEKSRISSYFFHFEWLTTQDVCRMAFSTITDFQFPVLCMSVGQSTFSPCSFSLVIFDGKVERNSEVKGNQQQVYLLPDSRSTTHITLVGCTCFGGDVVMELVAWSSDLIPIGCFLVLEEAQSRRVRKRDDLSHASLNFDLSLFYSFWPYKTSCCCCHHLCPFTLLTATTFRKSVVAVYLATYLSHRREEGRSERASCG